jgi:large subunit ribosomal protein L9
VVLRSQLDNLGHSGAEVWVAPGYARNCLIPKKLAVYATPSNVQAFKVVLPAAEEAAITAQRELNMLRARIADVRLRFVRATNDGTHLYGSVTAVDVVEALSASLLRKLGIREKQVRFATEERSIREVGEHGIEIEPRPGVWAKMTVVVESA